MRMRFMVPRVAHCGKGHNFGPGYDLKLPHRFSEIKHQSDKVSNGLN